MPVAQERQLPAGAAIRRIFPGHASHAAAMPHQQRIFRLRLCQLDELDIHLFGFVFAVQVDCPGRAAAGKHAFLQW